MAISVKTRKMLWGRSGNRCNYPNCRIELVMDATETDDESIIGEECHIVGRTENGPRGISHLSKEKRDKYNNLILLCRNHHKMVDDQTNIYTVERLNKIKKDHERWVSESLSYDLKKQREDEIYAHYVEEWSRLTNLNNWTNWSSWVLGSWEPEISIETNEQLAQLRIWLFNRIWHGRYPNLEDSFRNFLHVLKDFYDVFHVHSEKMQDKYCTIKFYKLDWHEQERYNKLAKEYDFHVALVMDLMIELTRAANYVCDMVRADLMPSFRLEEGILLVSHGPDENFSYQTIRPEYRHSERSSIPYPGLKQFLTDREGRDFCFGIGESIDDPKFLRWYS